MAKRQLKSTSQRQAYKIPPSSYAVQTAETILHRYGVEFSKQDLAQQLMNNRSFYKRLLQLPALCIYNEDLIRKCNSIDFYCQEQLLNTLFANYSLMAASADVKPALSANKEKQLDQLQQWTSDLSTSLNDVNEQQQVLSEQSDITLKYDIKDWQKLVATLADNIIAKLKAMNFDMSTDFRDRLISRLDKQGDQINFSDPIITELKIKQQLTGIEEAVLGTLLEEQNHG